MTPKIEPQYNRKKCRIFQLFPTFILTQPYSNRTPLMRAACNGSLEACELLVRCGADVNAKDVK